MERLVAKYAAKLADAGITGRGAPVVGGLDAEAVWNREAPERVWMEQLFERLDISSVLFSYPSEPYRSVIRHLARSSHQQSTADAATRAALGLAPAGNAQHSFAMPPLALCRKTSNSHDYRRPRHDPGENSGLAQRSEEAIVPKDSETRTFLHEIPVVESYDVDRIAAALERRKGAILSDGGVVTFGTVSPEQAFVTFSSICFACFVKFFADLLWSVRWGPSDEPGLALARRVARETEPPPVQAPKLAVGPFSQEESVYAALCEAGRWTVQLGLVDSYFGNISHLHGGTLYISQTGSSLDELEGCIDPVPMDGSTCTAITASSEFSAHRKIVEKGTARSILHGHPRFAVALTLDCDRRDCGPDLRCHLNCPHKRVVLGDVPIVPGEIGTGKHGIGTTLPPALEEHDAALVYGHGVFVTGREDFRAPMARLLEVERGARQEVLRRLGLR